MTDTTAWAVVLAGGAGTRFWPLSTPSRPKQFLPLVTNEPLLADTVNRFAPLIPPERTLIVTGAALVESVRRAVPAIPPENVLAEPRPAGTAAALVWATRTIEERAPGSMMCCVHADWSIANAPRFRDTIAAAISVARQRDALVTVGIVPTRPDPGFGYILPGELLDGSARRVARFFEKPSRERAADLIAHGGLWNSGIFVWQASRFLAEVRQRTPELADALAAAPADAAAFFAAVRTSISVDVGVLERSPNVLVLPGDFGWDDIGTWGSLRRVRPLDAHGNASHGDAILHDAHHNVVHAMSGTVVLYGVENLVVVTTPGLTVVTTVDRATDLKLLLDQLRPDVREQP
ncbi:MAG TPA: sugar phosphate nucleotidyltransferase [Gemmatimonadaceae bacterium]|nr:sugar phosphate nucleotidyltransferase [Gemmatimonadaceae bacterium]